MAEKIEKNGENDTQHRIMSFFSDELKREINSKIYNNGRDKLILEEVRLRSFGRCSIVASGANILLDYRTSPDEVNLLLKRLCDMAMFAHRDELSSGYISLDYGIRVGVCGSMSYDGGKIVGVGSISALVFRIPRQECSFADDIYRRWSSAGRGGLLVCSPAGGGKTTFLRAFAKSIGRENTRVAVVDERREFDLYSYRDCTVDILSGYKRALGVEIAIRTMSCEVLIADEISSDEDARALSGAVGVGVSVIATAHGNKISDILKRDYIYKLVKSGLFSHYVLISKSGCRRVASFGKIDDTMLA